MVSYEWVQGNSAGPHRAAVTKLVLHTTEGGSIEGAVAAYVVNNSWPHLTVDSRSLRVCQHLPYDVAARSLRNLPGGVETNTQGVIQIEVVGRAAEPAGINWEWVGREVAGPVCADTGIPVQSTVTWVAYPESYGQFAAQRLGFNQFLAYAGILGHEHVPENDHGDPGAIPIGTLLAAAQPSLPPTSTPPKDDQMLFAYNPGNQKSFVLDVGWLEVSNDCFKRAEKLGMAISPSEADFAVLVDMANRKKDFYDNIAELVAQGNEQRADIVDALAPPPAGGVADQPAG